MSSKAAKQRSETVPAEIDAEINGLEYRLQDMKRELAELRRRRPHEPVPNYTMLDWHGNEVQLADLFGQKRALFLVHNMGTSCNYCTMWADGFNGLLPHLSDRAAFVVTSLDKPDIQRAVAVSRGWKFPMYSVSRAFVSEMGFLHADEGLMPGVSVFEKGQGGKIHRVGRAEFGPGDDYCAVWHFFDLLSDGAGGWEPKNRY